MLVTGWDLLILSNGTASLWLYGEQPGNPTPRAVPVGPLPAGDARRVVDWLCKRGRTDTEEVRRHVGRLERAGAATR
jgi:hypothetical protein